MDNHRRTLTALLIVGGGLIVYMGLQVNASIPGEKTGVVWSVLFGLFFFTFGLITTQNHKSTVWFDMALEKSSKWLGVSQSQVILIAMSPIFGYICTFGAGIGKTMYSPFLSVSAWSLGIALALIGGWRLGEEKPKFARSTVIWLVGLISLAFLLRAIATERIPLIFTGDEGSAGIAAAGFVSGEWNNIFTTSWFSFPSLFSFLQSLSIRIFGQTIEALRLLSALAGALTVGCVYLFGKSLFSQRVGLFAALTLSALHFHVHFSRIGLNNIWDGLWYSIFIGALCMAWESSKRWAYLLAGLALGLGQYFYVSSKGLFVILLAGLLLASLIQRKKFQQALPGIVLMILVTLIVVMPLVWFYIQQPDQLLAPMARVSLLSKLDQMSADSGRSTSQIFLEQLVKGFQAYTQVPIRFWYKPETPILRPIFATLFYFGLIILLLKYKDSRMVMLLLWLILFGLMGGLSESVPAAQRYVAAAPVCAILVGLGLHVSMETLENTWQKYSRGVTVLGYALLCIAMFSDLRFYFVDFSEKNLTENIRSNGMIAQHVAHQVKGKPADTQVAFFDTPGMGYYAIPSIQYLAPQVKGIDVPQSWDSFDKTLLNKDHVVFIIPKSRQDETLQVTKDFPNGYLYSDKSWNGELLFWVYDLP